MPAKQLHVWEYELDAKGKTVKQTGFHDNKEKRL